MDRLIVTSSAYRQSSAPDEAKAKIDPQNRLFWRMNRKRLEGEMIRDAALSVAGTLNPQIGGRPVRIPIEPEVYDLIFTEYERDGLWPVNPDRHVQNRRGIYLYNKRSVRLPLLSAFDQPDAITSCPVRPVSTHALQALSLFNSGFMQEVSQAFAARLEKACAQGSRTARSMTAWRLALSRRRGRRRRGWQRSSSRPAARCRISAWRCSIETSSSMSHKCHIRSPAVTRRDVLVRAAHGFGSLALGVAAARAARAERPNPLAAKAPHFAAKAKSVIFLFMVGGPSQVDTFDPKPALEKYNGQPLPASYGKIVSQFTKGDTPLLRSPWNFKKYGQCGRDVSTLFPHIAQCVDDLCFVRSFYTDSTVHAPAMYQVNTGRILMGYPSMGSWVTYGLGSESENLPAYVVMPQPEGTPEGGTPCWGAGFLPAVYQGTVFRAGRARSQSAAAGRDDAAAAAAHARLSAEDERDGHAGRRHRDGGADQLVRAGVPHAERRAGGGGPLEGDRRRRGSSTGWTRSTRRSSARAACWRGGWWSAGCGLSSCTRAAGRYRCSGTRTRTWSATTRRCAA